MLKTPPNKSTKNLSFGSKACLDDFLTANKSVNNSALENSQAFSSSKSSFIELNKQKIKKGNPEFLKLFKQNQPEFINVKILENSKFMETNAIYFYLVKCLKKERQGMIDFSAIYDEKTKEPKQIETKIRQFLYFSLQESLLMSQKQIEETKYFERLFNWFTEVFKQREMKLEFKKESNSKSGSESHDQDWMIRNSYKTNMPFQLGNYSRKLLNHYQFSEFRENSQNSSGGCLSNKNKQNLFKSTDSKYNSFGDNKAFAQSINTSISSQKSKQILPLLKRKKFNSDLSDFSRIKENVEFQLTQNEWKKSKAQFFEHLAKKINPNQQKTIDLLAYKTMTNQQKIKNKNKPFGLNCKVIQKLHAARLGIACSQFRNSKQLALKEKPTVNYDSPIFHPTLTRNYLQDIKNKKLDQLRKTWFSNEFKSIKKNTEESQGISTEFLDFEAGKNQISNDLFNSKNSSDEAELSLKCIDGIGLTMNPFEKQTTKTKKK